MPPVYGNSLFSYSDEKKKTMDLFLTTLLDEQFIKGEDLVWFDHCFPASRSIPGTKSMFNDYLLHKWMNAECIYSLLRAKK